MQDNPILEFSGEYFFLSNFYAHPLFFEGINWPTVEHAYQAMKSDDAMIRMSFLGCRRPHDAKKLGKKVKIRNDWETAKLSVMRGLVTQKFKQNPELCKLLLATGERYLEEGNWWGDRYWGVSPKGSANGRNHLGLILMDVRAKARAGTL